MMAVPRILLFAVTVLPFAAMLVLVALAAPGLDLAAGSASLGALAHVLRNTFWIVLGATALAWLVALPGVLTSFATLSRRAPGGAVRQIVDFGSTFPRLLWGVAGASLFGGVLGLGVSALTGILTLGCLLSPIVATTLQDGFALQARRVSPTCRMMGMTRFQAVWYCVLPAAAPSLWTALRLSLARGLGDAAAVILTSGSSFALASSLMDPGATLSVYVLVLVQETPGQQHTAYAAAALLFGLSGLLQCLPGLLSFIFKRSRIGD